MHFQDNLSRIIKLENDIKRLGEDSTLHQDVELERALEEDIAGRVWIIELDIYVADDYCLKILLWYWYGIYDGTVDDGTVRAHGLVPFHLKRLILNSLTSKMATGSSEIA